MKNSCLRPTGEIREGQPVLCGGKVLSAELNIAEGTPITLVKTCQKCRTTSHIPLGIVKPAYPIINLSSREIFY